MGSSVKVASGLGFLLIAPPSAYATYHVLSSGNSSGSSWLKEQGYEFSQPQFTSHSNISRGCSENLFKEMNELDNNKLYGCALMKMERTSNKKFIKFNSEVALRKGNDGWIINTVLENHKQVTPSANRHIDDRLVFKYLFTKKQLTEEPKEEKWFFNSIGADPSTPKIYIKTPKKEKRVWNDGEELERKDLSKEEDTISFSEKEEFSGVWISDNNKSESWIFENIEIWGSEKTYSEIFCNHGTPNGDCKDIGSSAGTKQSYKINNASVDTWEQGNDLANNSTGSVSNIMESQIIPMITAIKEIRGEWVNLSSICDLKDEKNPNQDQQINLRLYCTK